MENYTIETNIIRYCLLLNSTALKLFSQTYEYVVLQFNFWLQSFSAVEFGYKWYLMIFVDKFVFRFYTDL